MIVSVDGRPILALEIINWNIKTRLYNRRRVHIIVNLSEFDCHRIFLYTNHISQNQLSIIKEHNIHLLQIGFQILRRPCYEFYQERNYVDGREIFTNSVKAKIRAKILEFLDYEYYQSRYIQTLFTQNYFYFHHIGFKNPSLSKSQLLKSMKNQSYLSTNWLSVLISFYQEYDLVSDSSTSLFVIGV